MPDTVHVVPNNDLVDHEDEGCVCGPTTEHVPTEHGDAWVVVHHSLDGRERHE